MTPAMEKIPLKQAEIAVRRFNDMAIPHHLGLLKNHHSNIEKSLALGDWNKIKKEEINAMRVIKQIKNLLLEMDALREKVREEDLERFDAMMENGKQKAFDGMKEYLELQLKSPTNTLRSQGTYEEDDIEQHLNDTVEIGLTQAHQQTLPEIRANFSQQEHLLAQRQSCLDELQNLQEEIRDLNGMFHNMGEMVHQQGESVQAIADNAEEALENVQAGESNLRKALSYKKAMYPVVGALLGTCVGGPIGLVAGLKAGGLAAVGCGILGFTGGSVLKSNPAIMQGNIEEENHLSENSQETQEEIEMTKKDE
ncbi:syntaxin-17 [Stomoxys calcitrans]|uniref:t-SNARE coiled-coil homology domain-containing protein n=1 Tax=Stomoxys calcitrans TaxID=35570 RepID=A0A1I8NQP7_STOCA|nr:syntaxin-17 [Stomoxys calcitrans]